MEPRARAEPVAPAERVELLDVLRGFAVFGILLVNVRFFAGPAWLEIAGGAEWAGLGDRLAAGAVKLFAEGKFYALFSILFGVGMTLQMDRGAAFEPLFRRRLAVLLGIGLVHAVGIWYGDILVLYALTGFVLLALRDVSERALAICTAVLLAVPVLLLTAIVGAVAIGGLVPEGAAEISRTVAASTAERAAAIERARRVYVGGSWIEMLAVRVDELRAMYAMSPFVAPQVLALFLIGVRLGRRRVFQDAARWAPVVRPWLPWLGATGLVAGVAHVALAGAGNPVLPGPLALGAQAAQSVGSPALCLFYAGTILSLHQRAAWRRRLAVLAPVGRMALSNYLAHSVIFTTLCYGWGCGMYGRISPRLGIVLAVAVFGAQIPLSAWWLRRFRFGPLEWLWRWGTYGVRPALR